MLLHPRCANCHPNGDVPAQGMQMTPHQPPVTRGPDSHGVVGMECTAVIRITTCAQRACSGRAGLAPRAARDGVGRQDSAPHL